VASTDFKGGSWTITPKCLKGQQVLEAGVVPQAIEVRPTAATYGKLGSRATKALSNHSRARSFSPARRYNIATPLALVWVLRELAADGRRFLVLVRNEDAAPVTVVVNWLAEMNK